MSMHRIKPLFREDIYRPIEVEPIDDQVFPDEIDGSVVTDAIRAHHVGILDAHGDTPEVTSQSVLSKNAAAQAALGKLVDENRERLTEHTRLTADLGLPELRRDRFVALYPRLPSQLEVLEAAQAFRETFGTEVRELSAEAIAAELRRELEIDVADVESAHTRLLSNGLPGAGGLGVVLGQMRAILRGTDQHAILTFNVHHASIKNAVKRATELDLALSPQRLADLERARKTLAGAWADLTTESDLDVAIRARAATLEAALARDTFFLDLPAIDQDALAIGGEYTRRLEEALEARIETYSSAFTRLTKAPGWSELDEEGQRTIAAPIQQGMLRGTDPAAIQVLRSERDACELRLRAAEHAVHRALEGDRLVSVNLRRYFADRIDTEEQLGAALQGIREECTRLLGAGKKVLLS